MTTLLEFRQVGKTYHKDDGNTFPAVQDFDLDIFEEEFFCLLGPSGCGKSTVLNLVAGFEELSTGSIRHKGEGIAGPDADRGVIFQGNDSLYPWLTTLENVEFGLKVKGLPKEERRELANRYLELVGLRNHSSKFPHELSGGMMQRVQIARILCNDPNILLMDEPFGALDAITRATLQIELGRIWDETRKTVLFITHDLEEAILLGDRLGVMTAGPGAHIKEIVTVDLPRPRDRLSPSFLDLYAYCRKLVSEEAEKAMQQTGEI